ncbi:MAG: hypothetical protein KBC36_11630 [Spirochaetia bacterium]|nr:hypothetical protein [Spirochaetia bacterium]
MNKIGGEKASRSRGRSAATRGGKRRAAPVRTSRPLAAFAALGLVLSAASAACAGVAKADFHVSGRVIDASTGSPISGALVLDGSAGVSVVTGADGSFAFFTRYEDHPILVSAESYRPAEETLRAGLFGRSPVAVIDFVLEPAAAESAAGD